MTPWTPGSAARGWTTRSITTGGVTFALVSRWRSLRWRSEPPRRRRRGDGARHGSRPRTRRRPSERDGSAAVLRDTQLEGRPNTGARHTVDGAAVVAHRGVGDGEPEP